MRVLHAMAGAPQGGAETFFARLVVALRKTAIDQRVVVRPHPRLMSALNAAGVGATAARFGKWADLGTASVLKRQVAQFEPDVLLTWMNRATRACPRHRFGRRFVHVGTPRGYFDIKYYRHCDHILCSTPDIVEHFVGQGWPSDRADHIPNFAPDVPAPAVSRAELDTPEGVPLLLALGRLHRNKAFDVLLAALAALPDHWLWLAGSGPLEAQLKAEAARLEVSNRVRFLGWRDDTPALFAAADMFVCSSRHEPFGNIVIEAWAQRVPIVAAASSGPSLLIESGVTGLLCPVDDAPALAAAIGRLAGEPDLAARLVAAGRAAYEGSYTEEKVVARYLALFERVAG